MKDDNVPKKLSDKEMWRLTVTDNPHMTDNSKDLLNQLHSAGNVANVIGWIIIGLLIILGMGVLS